MPLVVMLFLGLAVALVANAKGRSPVGWFFLGFFLPAIGLILIIVLPDLRQERAFRTETRDDVRRLREQLRHEQMRNQSLHRDVNARLDAHDQRLGINTQPSAPQLDAADQIPALPQHSPEEPVWFYERDKATHGPITQRVLAEMVRRNEIGRRTLVWRNSLADWTLAERVPELAAVFTT